MTLSVDDAGIEVGYRHRWRPDRGEALHLGVVAVREGRFVGAHPDPAHREAGIPIALGNLGFFEQRKRSTARAEKNELTYDGAPASAECLPRVHAPAPVR